VRGALGAVALHALEKNPANRYRSPAALADDLARFLRGEAPRSTRLWPRLRRRLPAAALLVAAGAALAVGWRVAPRVLARGETDRLRAWHAQEAELDRSLARSPDDTAALVARADLQFERAVYGRERGRDPVPDFEGAERDLDRALALAPDHEPVRLRRARTRTNLAIERINAGTLTQEEVDRALADLDAVAHRTDGRILRDGFRLRVAFWLRGQGKNPRPLLERVLAEMPARLEHADDFLNRARVLADLGRYDEADVDFAEAARLAPKRLWLWLWWAQARYGARDLAGAERHLQAALALHDMSPSAWRMLGDVRAATGRLAEAETAYSKAIRLNPSLGPGLRERLATLKARSGTAESPVPAGGPAAE
jgi:tetratricopeptide (TPR) repeat protein